MVSPASAVFERELTQVRLTATFLARYSAFIAWAISHVLNTKTVELLDTILVSQYQAMVVLPTVDAATPAGYRTDQALEYFQNEYLAQDISTVVKAIKAYAEAKELTKRAQRNLLREAIKPDARVLERIPDELLSFTGKGAPKLKHKGFPFAESGMTYEDRIRAQARTIATGMQGFQARREAERNDEDLRWVTMRDDRVRVAHVHAQGQTVPADEPFYVGGYPMWFPGDPAAPEDLTVNCRCVLATVAKPERRWVQRYVPAEWLNAAGGLPGMAPSQARAPKGSPGGIGGEWIDTPGAMLRSLNRLRHGTDLSPDAEPTDLDAADAERTRLADEILAREGRPSVQETADRLGAIYDRTTPEQRAAGEKWYDEARVLAQEMADNPNTDLTEEQAAAIIAHLSTQTRWEANADYARSLANGLTQDEALAHLREGVLTGRLPRPKQGGDFIYDDNWQKALNASVSGDPIGFGNLGTFSEANKTRTFAGNIMGDKDGVTVDVWMQRLLGQSLLIPAGGEQLKFPDPKTGKLKVFSKKKREDQIYESLSQSLRVAAKERGISPREMQAITWGWGLANYTQAREGHPGRFIDGDLVMPDVIGGEQALIDSGDLAAALVYMPEPRPTSLAEEPMPDYWYAQAAGLLGLPRQTPPELEPGFGVRGDLTAADQARAPMGAPGSIGGQFIDTPSGILNQLGWAGEDPTAPDAAYEVPATNAPDWDAHRYQAALGQAMPPAKFGFSPEEQKAIENYTGEDGYRINRLLRGDTAMMNAGERLRASEDLATLTSAMAKSTTPGDLVVYRGVGEMLPMGSRADTLVGKVIADKAFMSASLDESAARQFAVGSVLKITVPKGSHAIWADELSVQRGEMEMILPPSSALAITGVTHETYKDYLGNDLSRAVIHATVAAPSSALTASAPNQARAPKGSAIGGQWIPTPGGMLADLGGGSAEAYVTPPGVAKAIDTMNEWKAMPVLDTRRRVEQDLQDSLDRPKMYEGDRDAVADQIGADRDAWKQTAPKDLVSGARNYTSGDYWTTNAMLRGQTTMRRHGTRDEMIPLDPSATGYLQPGVDALKTQWAANSLHTGDQETVAFRGFDFASDDEWPVGTKMRDGGITSASMEGLATHGFGRTFQVLVPPGTSYLPGNYDEREVMFPPGSVYERVDQWTVRVHPPGTELAGHVQAWAVQNAGTGGEPGDSAERFTGFLVDMEPVSAGLTASGAPAQARAPKGSPGSIGGQWIPTPATILAPLRIYGWDKTGEMPTTGDGVYEVAQTEAGPVPEDWELTSAMHPTELTMSEREAVTNYSGYSALHVNNSLRYPENFPPTSRITQTTAVLDSALTRQALPDDMTLYRDAPAALFPYDSQAHMDTLVGKVMTDKAFLSTTTNGERVGGGGKIVIDISAPKGTPALWVKPFSEHPEESEMLLGRDLPLAITGVYNDYGTWHVKASVARPLGAPDFPAPVPKVDLVDPSQANIVYDPYGLTAGAPTQSRAPKGTEIGGQWIDTPQTLLMGLSTGERPGPFEAGSPDAAERMAEYDEYIDGMSSEEFRNTPIGASDVLHRAYAYTGYDKARPTVVDAIEHGPDTMYRGTAPGWGYDENGGGHDITAADITEDFRSGDHWAGKGIHGDGSYFARNTYDPDKAWLVGNNYAGDTDGAVLRARWKPEARVLTFNSDYDRQEWDRLNIEASNGSQAAMNTGVAASLLGYDGIRVGQGGGGWYEVILNRGAVDVQASDVPVREEWL